MDKIAQYGRQALDFAIQRIDLAFNAFGNDTMYIGDQLFNLFDKVIMTL